jgi:hypothetical protein
MSDIIDRLRKAKRPIVCNYGTLIWRENLRNALAEAGITYCPFPGGNMREEVAHLCRLVDQEIEDRIYRRAVAQDKWDGQDTN